MEQRSSDILSAVLREFIETGEPVSSEYLFENYGFGIKPAMIRLELNELTEQGYLDQPHHSAGRVPSDRGYEFFAEQVLADERSAACRREFLELLEKQAWQDLGYHLSNYLGVVSAAVSEAHGLMFKGMLQNLVAHLEEWNSREEIHNVVRDFEELESRLPPPVERMRAEPDYLKIYIGRKSPITRSENLSVVECDLDVGGERFLLYAIGPKRMDYEKATKVFRGLKKKTNDGRTQE